LILEKEYDVLCVGFVAQDIILSGIADDALERDSTYAEHTVIAPGGDAANQAVTLVRLGNRTALAANVGRDLIGTEIYHQLEAQGVDMTYCHRDGIERSTLSIVVIKPNGERSFLVGKGAGNLDITIKMIDLTVLDKIRAISLGSLYFLKNLDQGGAAELFRLAKAKQVLTFADMTTDAYDIGPEAIAGIYPYTDYMMPSYEEGVYTSGKTGVDEIADFFLAQGVGNVILKLGKNGCFVKNKSDRFYVDPYQIKPLDTTGCGDSFCAGFISGVLEGKSIEECAVFACAAGAVNAENYGAHGAVKDKKQVTEFIQKTPRVRLNR